MIIQNIKTCLLNANTLTTRELGTCLHVQYTLQSIFSKLAQHSIYLTGFVQIFSVLVAWLVLFWE